LGSVGCYRVRSRISNSKFLYQNLQGNIIWVFESTDLTLKTPTDPKGNPPLSYVPRPYQIELKKMVTQYGCFGNVKKCIEPLQPHKHLPEHAQGANQTQILSFIVFSFISAVMNSIILSHWVQTLLDHPNSYYSYSKNRGYQIYQIQN
jgi:hypothetical protein